MAVVRTAHTPRLPESRARAPRPGGSGRDARRPPSPLNGCATRDYWAPGESEGLRSDRVLPGGRLLKNNRSVGISTIIVAGPEAIGWAGCLEMPGPNPRLTTLGRTLRKARRDLDLSQDALGRRAGMHANHVSAIERGTKDLRASTLLRLIEALDLTPAELFTRFGDQGGRPRPSD